MIFHRTLVLVLAINLLLIGLWPVLGFGHDSFLWAFYSKSCQQRIDRSYALDGTTLPVCARCLGIWTGLLLASLSASTGGARSRLWSPWTASLLIALLGLDWAIGRNVFPTNWHLERTITGLLGGVGSYIGVIEICAWAVAHLRVAASHPFWILRP
jgi:uncharacterized membrane protein